MEIYAGAAMAKVGQVLQQQRDVLRSASYPNLPRPGVSPGTPNEMPSMNNAYASDHWSRVRADERQRGAARWGDAQDPWKTGMVPEPAYASMFQPLSDNINVGTTLGPPPGASRPPTNIQTMSGSTVSREEFTHNNMQPFFRGSVTQNMGDNAMSGTLERHTGRSDLQYRKQAVECFFEPTAGFTNVCGAPNTSQYERERIAPFVRRNNDFPVEQVRVAPGLGKGFTSKGDGGFQQAVTLDYVMPKNVDQLRVATNPKIVAELKDPQGPMKGTVQRGLIGKVDKNRPDTYYEQTTDMLLKTTGAQIKSSLQPEQMLKATARVDTHVEYKGGAQVSATKPGFGSADDFGKGSVMTYKNERDVTGTRSVIGNLTSLVKSVVSPLLDIFRHNHKEYTIDAPRIYGNMQAQIPSKPTTYDPVTHMLRTTIKEQTIHDTTIMNPRGNDAPPVESDDQAKTTVRETLPCTETTRNIAAHTYTVTVYDIDSVAKTTVRQTMKSSGSMFGFVGGDVTEGTGAYSVIDVEMPATQKQFISDYEYEGVAGSKTDFRPMSHEADENAEIDGTREAINIAAGNTPAAGGAFIGVTKDQIEMDTRKIMGDSIAVRETGNPRGQQYTARPIEACEVTRVVAKDIDANAQENRLDSSILSSLAMNPYAIKINPIQDAL
jgi:hypothetical protein